MLSLLELTKQRNPVAALKKIQVLAGKSLKPYFTVASAVQLVALNKMLGDTPKVEYCEIGADEYVPHDEWLPPYFMGVPAHKAR